MNRNHQRFFCVILSQYPKVLKHLTPSRRARFPLSIAMERGIGDEVIFDCWLSKDRPFVRRLANALLDNDINVWLDEKDILVGQSFIERMQDRIQKADFVAIILTPNFLNGPWANRELQMALNKEVQSSATKVLPILRKDCDIPGFLAVKSYADFRGKKFEVGMRSLMQSISELSKMM